MSKGKQASISVLAGVFLTTMSLLLLELVLTRIFSVTLFYHFAFMAISIAMFGLGLSGLIVFLLPSTFAPEKAPRQLSLFSALFALSIPLTAFCLFHIGVDVQQPFSENLGLFLLIYLLSALPFFLCGLCLSLALTHYAPDAGRVYFADLMGSGLACLLVIPVLDHLGGTGAVLLASALAALACLAFSRPLGRRAVLSSSLLAATLLLLALLNPSLNILEIHWVKGRAVADKNWRFFDKWNSFSRVSVHPRDELFSWGLSDTYQGPAVDQIWMIIDDEAGTPITRFDGDTSKLAYLKHDVTTLAHTLTSPGKTLVIGPGGGMDVLAALVYGDKDITAVELNPLIAHVVDRHFGEFSGHLYSRPEVKIAVDDGRSFTRRSDEAWDLIQISLIDTWAATAAGAFSLSENNLYTVEAIQDYLHHLKADGMLSISRFIFDPPRQALRVASLFAEAARREGFRSPQDHIFVARMGNIATCILKKTPFSPQELSILHRRCEQMGFPITFSPILRPPPPRLFDVFVNGQPVLRNLDILQRTGGSQRAWSRSFLVDAPKGRIDVDFKGRINHAKVSALEVRAVNGDFAARINAGGPTTVDGQGHVWVKDREHKRGSFGYRGGDEASSEIPIDLTEDDRLYQSERWGNFAYAFDVPEGRYTLTAHFAETYFHDNERIFFNFLHSADPRSFYRSYPFDVTPSTDDKPFFFHVLRLKDFTKIDSFPGGQRFNYVAISSLVSLFIIVTLLSLAFLLLPLWIKPQGPSGRGSLRLREVPAAGYFSLLGLAFMLVEVGAMQRFILLLGHPIYALTVILFSLLAFGGIGSLLSSRIDLPRLPKAALVCSLIVALMALFHAFLLPLLLSAAASLSISWRIVVSVIAMAPLTLLMGMLFPSGLRLASRTCAPKLPWFWALNGALSVFGSVAAIMVAISWGFTLVLILGALAYGLAALMLLCPWARQEAVPAQDHGSDQLNAASGGRD